MNLSKVLYTEILSTVEKPSRYRAFRFADFDSDRGVAIRASTMSRAA